MGMVSDFVGIDGKVNCRGLSETCEGMHIKLFHKRIEQLHFHSNENRHKSNHGYSIKFTILLYKFQCMSYDRSVKMHI